MGDLPDTQETADYILDLSNQLAKLASEARLDLLAYLLDMVRIEAELVRDRAKTAATPGRPRA